MATNEYLKQASQMLRRASNDAHNQANELRRQIDELRREEARRTDQLQAELRRRDAMLVNVQNQQGEHPDRARLLREEVDIENQISQLHTDTLNEIERLNQEVQSKENEARGLQSDANGLEGRAAG